MPRVELSILDQIQALSNERQELWRIAHVRKFSHDWRIRHDRIESITRQLKQLWHLHRIELVQRPDQQQLVMDRITGDHFIDFRERAGAADVEGEWRIEDETYHDRRYMTVTEGIIENNYAQRLKKPTKKRSSRPNVGARQRQKGQLSAHSML